jgi:hypothetical protein
MAWVSKEELMYTVSVYDVAPLPPVQLVVNELVVIVPFVKPVDTPGVVFTTTLDEVTVTAQPGLLAVNVYTPASAALADAMPVLKDAGLIISLVVGPVHAYVAAPVEVPVNVSGYPEQAGLGVTVALTPVGYALTVTVAVTEDIVQDPIVALKV